MPLFETTKKIPSTLLRDRYLVPPFSILDAKVGSWLDRRKQWESVLHDREDNIRDTSSDGNTPYILSEYWREQFHVSSARLISTFDPFLAEIIIKWFSKVGMKILDPFAGGIVRGAVSTILGRDYLGIDISKAQVSHNEEQWEKIRAEYLMQSGTLTYLLGDAEVVASNLDTESMDMLFTCPPYYNLEVYTDDPNDLSLQDSYQKFLLKYTNIIERCYNVLKEDTFGVIVVSEIRAPDGSLYGFVPDTVKAFTAAGFKFYNELILENCSVSLSVRCPKYFDQSRKIGKHHQNVLVFYKGNLKNIEKKFGKFTEGK